MELKPVFLMQPIPYFGEKLKGEWIVEPKIDGWRLQIIKYKNEKIEYWGRRLEKKPNWTKSLNYLDKFLTNVPSGTLLDCELYSTKGRRGIPSVLKKTGKAKPLIFVFDVVFFNGKFIGEKTLKERKKILEKIKFKEPFFALEFEPLKNLKKAMEKSAKKGYEGVILKELNSKYQISYQAPIATHHWRKIKF
jgi:bifunctional non-homologous end joining protein LigD